MDALEVLSVIQGLDILAVAEAAVEDNVGIIADLNATQLSQGRRSDGSDTLPSYSALTIALKGAKTGLASITDHVTLYDTGAFYRGLYADVHGENIEFGSRDPKADKLQARYSTSKGSIFGLNEDSREELIASHLQSDWEKRISDATGLEFG